MVSYYTAKVARGQIVIRDVDLPDGTEVSVKVERDDELRFTPEIEAELRASEAEHRRGESVSGDEALANLRRYIAFRAAGEPASREVDPRRPRSVVPKPRNGAKSTRRRAR
jgi:hypothetical protein